ncbi:helix-turn-helix domain-containing protein [Micromonospora sp. NPDC049048]|uniref:helix-turn-helix domain-containing protein n=1 Tax=Micromonospora sp. NPDC049048 TaxID=3364263 RepID=UPI003718A27F
MASEWLTVQQVADAFRAAGYPDSAATLRRMIDAGEFGAQGDGWYRTERGGYRMVKRSAVDDFLRRRAEGQ